MCINTHFPLSICACIFARVMEELINEQQGFLEELLALTRETWESTLPATGMNDHELFSTNGWSLDCFDQNPGVTMTSPYYSSSCGGFFMPTDPPGCFDSSLNEAYYSFGDGLPQLLIPGMDLSPSYEKQEDDTILPFSGASKEECLSSIMEELQTSCKVEPVQVATEVPKVFNMGFCGERKNGAKKVEGKPSKNLMAERRRRKRLNDRLSMLRSVVPKISKMDRTSILGDTIDYMKELLERVKSLKGEIEESSSTQLNLMDTFNELKSNEEILVRNTPKFDVQRRNIRDTRVEICCAGKPGLLLSTVTTLEALGLDIQQCVISCFNDFTLHASCSQEMEQREIISCEDIKQAFFRNAGYGGRCL